MSRAETFETHIFQQKDAQKEDGTSDGKILYLQWHLHCGNQGVITKMSIGMRRALLIAAVVVVLLSAALLALALAPRTPPILETTVIVPVAPAGIVVETAVAP